LLTKKEKNMQNVKRLGLSLMLVAVLFTVALAGEIPSPPCALGQTDTPPCSQMTGGSTDPGETNGPPSSAADVTTIVEAVELALSLF
jgi:hypothetical protein